MPDYHNGTIIEKCPATDYRWVVTVTPVTVQLHEIPENPADKIERIWASLMASKLNSFEGR
jgi:hypothetical protein